MKQTLGWPLIIIGGGIAILLIVIANWASLLRPLLVFGYLLVCPGMAFVRLLSLKNHFAELMLAVALSLTICTLISEMLVLMRSWSMMSSLVTIVVLSIVGAILQLITQRRAAVTLGDS